MSITSTFSITPRITIILIFLSLFIGLSQQSNDFKCSKNTRDFKCTLSSKTPYRFLSNSDKTATDISGCEAQKIWMISRHGTRFPSTKNMANLRHLPRLQEEILKNCKTKKCNLTGVEVEKLENWKIGFQEDDGNLLATEGGKELSDLARRFQSRFPDLMPTEYNNQTFKFRFTDSQRTRKSAEFFTAGLFGEGNDRVQFPKPEKRDPILEFYKVCKKWKLEIKDNPNSRKQIDIFINSSVVSTMLHQLSDRLGINATFDTAKMIQNICAFETAWNNENQSPWCDLLTLEDFKIIEFYHDLEYYWIDGYGYPLNYQQACPAISDMFDFFRNNNSNIKTSVYFSHSGALLKLISFLGIAKGDSLLLHDSYFTSEDRNWRTSLIDSFATNLAFILYDCSTEPGILLMHQERIVNLPGCPENRPCPLEKMEDIFPDTTKGCNFKELCKIDNYI